MVLKIQFFLTLRLHAAKRYRNTFRQFAHFFFLVVEKTRFSWLMEINSINKRSQTNLTFMVDVINTSVACCRLNMKPSEFTFS